MKRGGKFFAWVLLGLLVVAAVVFVTQHLWNWLVPVLFNGPSISFWQAAGLLLLSKILFSGLGGKCHDKRASGMSWKYKMYDKFAAMSPEEREAFKKKMQEKWCPSERQESPEDTNV